MSEIKFKKSDPIKTFSLRYFAHKGNFYGAVEVESDGMVLKGETGHFDSPEDTLKAMKELLIRMYVKIDYKM